MCLRDDGAVNAWLQLRDIAIAIVHPDLHEAHAAHVKLPHVIASLRCCSRAVGDTKPRLAGRATDRSCCDAFPYREEARRIRDHLVAKLVRQLLVRLEAHAQRGRDAVVRVALQHVNEDLASIVRFAVAAVLLVDEADVVVAVDERRHHRLPREIHARRALRRLTLSLPADPRERLTLDEKSRVLDRVPVADDESCALEPRRRVRAALCVRDEGKSERRDETSEGRNPKPVTRSPWPSIRKSH